jgi:hypothetical protein
MEAHTLVTLIEKEDIPFLSFNHTEPEVENPLEIKRQLTKALHLGNAEKHKVRLIFDSDDGLKMVYTTIWALDDRYVQLKKGVIIPVDNIIEVHLL